MGSGVKNRSRVPKTGSGVVGDVVILPCGGGVSGMSYGGDVVVKTTTTLLSSFLYTVG